MLHACLLVSLDTVAPACSLLCWHKMDSVFPYNRVKVNKLLLSLHINTFIIISSSFEGLFSFLLLTFAYLVIPWELLLL